MSKRLSASKKRAILRDYKTMTAKEVAAKYNVREAYVTTLQYVTKKNGLKPERSNGSTEVNEKRAKEIWWQKELAGLRDENYKLKAKLLSYVLGE